MKQNHAEWCRDFFDNRLNDGALWHVPRSGLVFRRLGNVLRLVATVPAEEKRLDNALDREADYQTHKAKFAKAGITVETVGGVPPFSSFELAQEAIFAAAAAKVPGNPFMNENLIQPRDMLGSRAAPPHRFGPGYDAKETHSLGIKVAPPGIAKSLLQRADDFRNHVGLLHDSTHPPDNRMTLPEEDTRPLIDQLHEATFTNPVGMHYIADLYSLRGILRKAHCFTLDADTSALTADFSVAIANDFESARRMAIPPFPVTWIDIDNVARLNRIKELGGRLTATAAGETEAGPPVDRVGWLIQPDREFEGAFYASYVASVTEGVVVAPLSFWWSTITSNPNTTVSNLAHQLCLGVDNSNLINPADAYVKPCPQQDFERIQRLFAAADIREPMTEISGELRHIWGFLIALGAGQLGVEATMKPQPLHTDIRKMPNGKPLLPLEHKLLHLHLNKRHTASKVVIRMITHHKHRWHEVRAHWRTLRNADGSVKKRVPVKTHERGDERLGRVEKTYRVER